MVHSLESVNLVVCFTSAQASYLASLWVFVSLSASKCAECRVWCALVVSRGWGAGLRLGIGTGFPTEKMRLKFSLRSGVVGFSAKFEHSIFYLPRRGKPGRVAGGPT